MAIDVTITYARGVDFQISYKSTNRSTKKEMSYRLTSKSNYLFHFN